MSDKARAFFLSLTIVAMLVFSAVGTTTVFADDDPTTGSSETDTTTTDTTDQGDTSTSSEEQQPAEVTPPLLEQLPENTTVAVVDTAGEVQPLVSQDSAEAVLLSDPIWCPEGQVPTPGANGCTASYSSFTELLDYLKVNEGDAAYQQAGTIYVQQGAYLGGESSIDFNSYNFTNLNQHNLTVHGGWDTVDNSLDSTDTSQFTAPIIIGSSSNPWVGSLTFNNIFISNVSGQTGLTLYSQGNINLSNVEVTNSLNGADLNAGGNVTVNDSKFNKNKKNGANISAGGDVEVANSQFNENGSSLNEGKGLNVNGGANVSLADIQANNNQVFGANVNAVGDVTVTNSFFSGNQAYTYKCKGKSVTGGYGLQIITNDDISLDGVTASDNYFFGAHLEGASVQVYNSHFNNNGSGNTNVGKGLEVNSDSYVTLIGVEANDNRLFGANVNAAGDVVVNNSFFSGNKSYTSTCSNTTYHGYGLQVVTTGGIFLSEVSATENNLFGAHLEGNGVFISGGTFNNNGNDSGKYLTGKGLEITSATDVSLSNVQANNNQLFGANIQAAENVVISNGFFNGNKSYTYSCKGKKSTGGYGLQITAGNDIALNVVEASDNYLYGAQLSGANISIATASFNNNGSGSLDTPVGKGLEIESTGNVSLTFVEANNNQLSGATIQASGDVAITNGFFNGNKSYTYSCKGKTYYGYGLQIVTTEAISLNNVAANENYLYGAHLEGTDVSISFSTFDNNGTGTLSESIGKGLEVISSAGLVSLYGVSASNNQLFGANIQAVDYVVVTNSFFNGNQSYTSTCKGKTYNGYGIKVVTTTGVYLDRVEASENNLFGASLSGNYVNVANSSFNFNGSGDDKNPTGKGLQIKSSGDVSLLYVEALNNELFGANIEADGNVVVTGSFFAGNKYYTYTCKGSTAQGYGLKIVADGDILLNADANGFGNQAYDNGSTGAIIEGGTSVTVSDSSFYNNGASGLSITTAVDVSLNNVTATGNGLDGVDVKATCSNTVYVNGGTFADNAKYGIKVVNAGINMDGAQTFSNNPAGNVFNDRTTCFVSTGSGNSNSGNNNTSNGNSYHNGGYGNGGNHGQNHGCSGYKKGHSYGR